MKTRKFEVIACPKCGREYLPAELYVPNAFFGRPRDIVRDVYGTILDYEGTSVDLQETYICDKCNTNFVVAICFFEVRYEFVVKCISVVFGYLIKSIE